MYISVKTPLYIICYLRVSEANKVPISTQPLSHMVQHVADWVAPLPCSQHSPSPPLKFFHTPPSPSPSFFTHNVHEN